jgi:hypothetical protein
MGGRKGRPYAAGAEARRYRCKKVPRETPAKDTQRQLGESKNFPDEVPFLLTASELQDRKKRSRKKRSEGNAVPAKPPANPHRHLDHRTCDENCTNNDGGMPQG